MVSHESEKPILQDYNPSLVEENHKNKPKYGIKFTLQEPMKHEFLAKGLKAKFS